MLGIALVMTCIGAVPAEAKGAMPSSPSASAYQAASFSHDNPRSVQNALEFLGLVSPSTIRALASAQFTGLTVVQGGNLYYCHGGPPWLGTTAVPRPEDIVPCPKHPGDPGWAPSAPSPFDSFYSPRDDATARVSPTP